jgi:hypothetical protein
MWARSPFHHRCDSEGIDQPGERLLTTTETELGRNGKKVFCNGYNVPTVFFLSPPPDTSLKGDYSNRHRPSIHPSVRPPRIGFRVITCERKIGLKLGVACMCILWISRSTSIIAIFRQFYHNYAPFCTSNLLNCWFPDDNLWANNQMCGISVSRSSSIITTFR